MPDSEEKEIQSRSFWSGTVTFGLVSIPVSLFPGQRQERVRLRMLGPDGTPLARRYYCPVEGRQVDREEIIRGYEIEKGKFVTVTDRELDSLQPGKSREIDLRRFVPVEQIDPILFDRAYFLVPSGDSVKPYRLLAETMEKTGKAGIATFVMKGREYLVAILAENGILMAETLRFADEIRSPRETGIPAGTSEASGDRVEAMINEIRAATSDELDMNELEDDYSERIVRLAEEKLSAGRDVVSVQGEERGAYGETGNVIDLMEILKRSMEKESGGRPDVTGF